MSRSEPVYGEGLSGNILVGLTFSGLDWALTPFSGDWNFLESTLSVHSGERDACSLLPPSELLV